MRVLANPIGVVELPRLSLGPLQEKCRSEYLKAREYDGSPDWDLHLVGWNRKAVQHCIRRGKALLLVEAVPG